MLQWLKNNQVTENIISLVGLKGIEYILNFILYPYLLRVLGVEKFGMIAFMQGVIQYIIIVVDYGFNMTGPRDIARARTNMEVGRVFSDIMCAKFFLVSVTTVFGGAVLFFINGCRDWNLSLICAIYVSVIGNFIFPVWFFQGIQKMKYITIFNVIARTVIVALIICLVNEEADYVLAAFLQSSTFVLSGVFSFYILRKKYKYIFVQPSWAGVLKTLHLGWHVFFSTVSINIYTTTNVVILGALTNDMTVGYFSAANKLIDCIKGVMNAITQAVYPHISKSLTYSSEEGINFLRRFLKAYSGLCGLGSTILFFIASWIIRFLFGNQYEQSIQILQLMAFIPFVVSISNVFGIQVMLNWNRQKIFSRILAMGAVLDCATVIPAIEICGGEGVAMIMLMTELFISVCTVIYVSRTMKLKLFP